MKPQNLLILLSDEHNPKVLGCAGHPEIHTPNLDALAARGTRFTRAYCSSPICVPTRAAMMTGRPVYETGYWDNVDAWDGKTPGWSHVLRERGHEVTSIGKLHFRGWQGDDYGFTENLLPMHIHKGHGMLQMLVRNPPLMVGSGTGLLMSAKAGYSEYNQYDENIVARAQRWLQDHGNSESDSTARPWVLMVSLVAPHFPLTVPEPYFSMYANRPLALPKDYVFGIHPDIHPFLKSYAEVSKYNLSFKDEADVRRALAGYYGLVTFLDFQIGLLLKTLEDSGLAGSTRIVYLSDHGDNVGTRGLWGKSTMYEESAGIPLIIAGDSVPAGRTVHQPASHLDLFATVLEAVGAQSALVQNPAAAAVVPHSQAWWTTTSENRLVFSEYHTIGSRSALFMLTDQRYKYVYYCDHPAQLFDLAADPEERLDLLAGTTISEHSRQVAERFRQALYSRLDPEEVDRRAKARQAELLELFGGIEAAKANTSMSGFTPAPLS